MKKIFKFIAPNGEYVTWGEFDGKQKIISFEVEKFNDEGILMEKEIMDFVLPENLGVNSKWEVRSSYRSSDFLRCDKPQRFDNYDAAEKFVDSESKPEDNRKILID